MYRPTEYAVMKRLLFATCDFDPNLTKADANKLIGESVEAALDKMPPEQRGVVLNNQKRLTEHSKEHNQMLGDMGALEVLAAIAHYLPESEE